MMFGKILRQGRVRACFFPLVSLLVLAVVPSLAGAADGVVARSALIIGNGDYERLPKLANAQSDADRIGETLEAAGFEVMLGKNLTKVATEDLVREFLRTLDSDDVALFYYSGHAVQVAGENYLIPTDSRLESPYDLETEAYSISNILNYVRSASGVQLIFLDACRDNPFRADWYYRGNEKLSPEHRKGLASIAPAGGTLIAYSTAPDQVAYDGAGNNSPFALAFIDRALSPNQEVRETLTDIRRDVITSTSGKQVPWDVSSLISKFYFVRQPETVAFVEPLREIRVSSAAEHVELNLQPPVASGQASISVLIEKLPRHGGLFLNGNPVTVGQNIDPERLPEVIYLKTQKQAAVDFFSYKAKSADGLSAEGAVALVFDPALNLQEGTGSTSKKPSHGEKISVAYEIGTPAAPLITTPVRGLDDGKQWLKVVEKSGAASLAIDDRILIVGDALPASDLAKGKVFSKIRDVGTGELKLQPIGGDSGSLTVSLSSTISQCDQVAAEPLDVQSVSRGVFPNELDIEVAISACSDAVERYPDTARFKFQKARALFASGKTDEAVGLIKEASEQGHARASQFLGRLHQIGVGVEKDPAKAVSLFRLSVDRGDPYGQYSLGRAMLEGAGVTQDVGRGVALLQRSAEAGHTYAMNMLGSEYLSGQRVPQDIARASAFFTESVERGDVWGKVNLGILFRDARGVVEDRGRAALLFEEARASLHPYAGTLLALMDRRSANPDSTRQLTLFRESALRGDAWGAFHAAEMLRGAGDRSMESVWFYALAASRDRGKASEQARLRLADENEGTIILAVQETLKRLGHTGVKEDGKLGSATRSALQSELGATASVTPEILIELAAKEWGKSRPRYDMLGLN